jgi:hypothetical protein
VHGSDAGQRQQPENNQCASHASQYISAVDRSQEVVAAPLDARTGPRAHSADDALHLSSALRDLPHELHANGRTITFVRILSSSIHR